MTDRLFFRHYCILLLAIFLCLGFTSDKTPALKIITKNVDLGDIERNKIINFTIEVENAGEEDLIIENVYASCGCLEITDKRWPAAHGMPPVSPPAPVVLEPGKRTYITASLNSGVISGQFEKMISIVSNDPALRISTWIVKGNSMDLANPSVHGNPLLVAQPIAQPDENAKVIMVFYAEGCRDCEEIMRKFLPKIQEKYKGRIAIDYHDINNPAAFAILIDMQNKYEKRAKKGFFNPKPPAVFIDGRFLYGVKDIEKNLEKHLK